MFRNLLEASPTVERVPPTTQWASLWAANGILFLIAVQVSIFIPSMWPFLKEIECEAKESNFGAEILINLMKILRISII